MATLTEPTTFSDWLVMEGGKRYSRDDVTLLAGKKYVSGEVLGIVTATFKYTSYNQDGTDGTENAVGVLMEDVDATDSDMPGVAIVRHAQVLKKNLTWPDDIDPGEKDSALGYMKYIGILGV